MSIEPKSQAIQILKDTIDITRAPFSNPGSRLLIYKYKDHDSLYIKIAKRFTNLHPGIESYLSRQPFIQNLSFVDETSTPLRYELITYPHALIFQTKIGTFKLSHHAPNKIAICLPWGVCAGIRGIYVPISSEETQTLIYRSNNTVFKDVIHEKQDHYTFEILVEAGIDSTIHITPPYFDQPIGEIPPFTQTLTAAEYRWHTWLDKAPKIDGPHQKQYYYAWWVLVNNLVEPHGYIKYPAIMPSKHKYVGIWNWDACFHTLAIRHIDPELARNQLRVMLNMQRSDGMIPDVVFDEGIVNQIDHPFQAEVTKPPIIAWAALKIHNMDPNPRFLREIYPSLVSLNKWWFTKKNINVDGLAHYNHPYSSGMDDNPTWDLSFPVVSPDLNTYLTIQMDSLAHIADILGYTKGANIWRTRANKLVQLMIEQLFDPEVGLFWATHDHRPIEEITPINLYPLWTGRLNKKISENLISHLTNEKELWAPYPIATVAMNSPKFEPDRMWRGPAWVNVNYLFIEALKRLSRFDLAKRLQNLTIELVSKNNGIFEYYNPQSGMPSDFAAPMFSWTSALFIDLLIQEQDNKTRRML
ncbi:MAG: trehalase family glycosidase [Anaerolineales bacterium]|jgi:glycogen debranching enzyme